MSWDHALEARLRRRWTLPAGRPPAATPTATPLGENGFLTEIAGKVILTAPARRLSVADELPDDMREKWERASTANPYFTWIQGRFVEAERANSNGAYWASEDLQVGEMTVRHGPLNWLHDAKTVIGTIADNKLVTPAAATPVTTASLTVPGATATYTTNTTVPVETAAQTRPYIAAVSAIWRWVHPEYARAVEHASENGTLWYSMEAISRQIACVSDGDRVGCGAAYDYLQAVTDPASTCEHIRARSCARRMVDPAFLGGAVIVPPVRPGWTGADAEVMRQAAALAEQVAPADAKAADWERVLAAVIGYAEGS